MSTSGKILGFVLGALVLFGLVRTPAWRAYQRQASPLPADEVANGLPRSEETQSQPSRGATTAPAIPAAGGQLARRVGRSCFGTVAESTGDGLFASWDGATTRILTPDGETRGETAARWPFGWSPTGTHLADAAGRLWNADGEEERRLLPPGAGAWGWSRSGDCAVKIADDGASLSLGVPGREPVRLVAAAALGSSDRIASFAFSDDGRKLAVVAGPGEEASPPSIFVLDLGTGDNLVVLGPSRRVAAIELAGWSSDGERIRYWTFPTTTPSEFAVMRSVSATSLSVPTNFGGAATQVLAEASSLTDCGSRMIGLVAVADDLRLAGLTSGESADLISEGGYDFESPSCSVDGRYLVAIRRPTEAGREQNEIVLLDSDGSFVRELADGAAFARWGPGRTGVAYVRSPAGGPRGEIWFIREGGTPNSTGTEILRVRGEWAFAWSTDLHR